MKALPSASSSTLALKSARARRKYRSAFLNKKSGVDLFGLDSMGFTQWQTFPDILLPDRQHTRLVPTLLSMRNI